MTAGKCCFVLPSLSHMFHWNFRLVSVRLTFFSFDISVASLLEKTRVVPFVWLLKAVSGYDSLYLWR